MHRSGFFLHLQPIGDRCFFIGLLFLSMMLSTQTKAQGDLLVMPRRLIFNGAMKTQELNLANLGKDTARYEISIIDIRMKEDGSFEIISEPDPGQNFAGRYIRFFPKSVTLAPNESQVVKMQVSKSNDMQAGEYRSHVYVRAIPDNKTMGVSDSANGSSISIHIVPVFGISVPVIIRKGETAAQVSFADVAFRFAKDSTPTLTLLFVRQGNRSVFGDFVVNFIPAQGKVVQVGLVKGIAVYTPNERRKIRMNLDNGHGINYHLGKLQLVYSTSSDVKYAKLAEAEVMLQ